MNVVSTVEIEGCATVSFVAEVACVLKNIFVLLK